MFVHFEETDNFNDLEKAKFPQIIDIQFELESNSN